MSRHSERSRPLGRHRAPIGALAALRAPFWHSGEPTVLFRAMAGGAALLIAAASLSALPQPVAGAAQPPAASQSSNALSTVSKSGTDTATNSTAVNFTVERKPDDTPIARNYDRGMLYYQERKL